MSRLPNPPVDEEDQGETIVDMNVDGMPWYMKGQKENQFSNRPHQQMSPEELRMYRWAALKAGLTIALIFGVVFALFIAFCDFIWFR